MLLHKLMVRKVLEVRHSEIFVGEVRRFPWARLGGELDRGCWLVGKYSSIQKCGLETPIVL